MNRKEFESESIMIEGRDAQGQGCWMDIKGWVYVCGLALFFLLYGLFMFYMIGDKGPPGWDFGAVEDVPGGSIYSTNEPVTGGTMAPEPQHVSQRPSKADVDVEKDSGSGSDSEAPYKGAPCSAASCKDKGASYKEKP